MATENDLIAIGEDIVKYHPNVKELEITKTTMNDNEGCHRGYVIKINDHQLPCVTIATAFGILCGLLCSAELS